MLWKKGRTVVVNKLGTVTGTFPVMQLTYMILVKILSARETTSSTKVIYKLVAQ